MAVKAISVKVCDVCSEQIENGHEGHVILTTAAFIFEGRMYQVSKQDVCTKCASLPLFSVLTRVQSKIVAVRKKK